MKVSELPPYVTVQMMRFIWKENFEGGTKAKILRSVSFNKILDLYEFCTDDLKKSLDYGR